MASALWSSVTGGGVSASSHVDPTTTAADPTAAGVAAQRVVGSTTYVPEHPVLQLGRSRLVLTATIEAHTDRAWGVAWHPTESNLFATCSGDKSVKLWSAHQGQWRCIGELVGEHQRTVRAVEWSPDGTRLAAASFDATVTIWRKASPQFAMELENVLDGHESEVKSVSWSRTGAAIASCARDKTVQLWEDPSAHAPLQKPSTMRRDEDDDDDDGAGDEDEETERQFDCVAILQGHTQDVKMVRFHPDLPTVVLSCGYDDVIKVWEESPNRKDDWHCIQTLKHHDSTVWSIAFQPVRPLLAATAAAGTGAGQKAFDAVPRLLASSSDDGSVALWRLVDDSADRPAGVKAVRWVVSGVCRDAHEGGAVFAIDWCPFATAPNAAATHSVSSVLASVGADESLVIYEVSAASGSAGSDDDGSNESSTLAFTLTPIVTQRCAHNAEVNCVRFAPTRSATGAITLATTSDDGTVKVWELLP